MVRGSISAPDQASAVGLKHIATAHDMSSASGAYDIIFAIFIRGISQVDSSDNHLIFENDVVQT